MNFIPAALDRMTHRLNSLAISTSLLYHNTDSRLSAILDGHSAPQLSPQDIHAGGDLMKWRCLIWLPVHASPALSEKIDQAMQKFITNKEVSGVVSMVIHEDNIIHFSALEMANIEQKRPMEKDTPFRLAPLTKNYSTVLLMTLAEQGKLTTSEISLSLI